MVRKKMLLNSGLARSAVLLQSRVGLVHSGHGQRRRQLQHSLSSVKAFPIYLNYDVILLTDFDDFTTLVLIGPHCTIEQFCQRRKESICEVSRTYDGAFDGCNGNVQEFVSAGPRTVCCALSIIFAEENSKDWLEKERIVF